MDDTFHLVLLRISIAQILRASGFDKCKPVVINIITDIYIRQFEHLLLVAKNFALQRSAYTNEIAACDVMEALLRVGLLKPKESELGPDSHCNTKSLESLLDWVKFSNIFSVSRKLNTIPPAFLYNLMEKRKIDTSAETDQERKKRRLRERQEFYNQLKQNDDANTDNQNGFMDDLEDEELSKRDKLSWLAYLAEKDVKLGQNMKFLNSCIQDDVMTVHKNKRYHPTPVDGEDSYAYFRSQVDKSIKNDYIIISPHEADDPKDGSKDNAVGPSSELKNALPYNIKYSEVLLDDDISQFIRYAKRHKREVSQRLATIKETETVQNMEVDPVGDQQEEEAEKVEEEAEETEKTNNGTEHQEGEKEDGKNGKGDEHESVIEVDPADESHAGSPSAEDSKSHDKADNEGRSEQNEAQEEVKEEPAVEEVKENEEVKEALEEADSKDEVKKEPEPKENPEMDSKGLDVKQVEGDAE